jgi:hypothetical protein
MDKPTKRPYSAPETYIRPQGPIRANYPYTHPYQARSHITHRLRTPDTASLRTHIQYRHGSVYCAPAPQPLQNLPQEAKRALLPRVHGTTGHKEHSYISLNTDIAITQPKHGPLSRPHSLPVHGSIAFCSTDLLLTQRHSLPHTINYSTLACHTIQMCPVCLQTSHEHAHNEAPSRPLESPNTESNRTLADCCLVYITSIRTHPQDHTPQRIIDLPVHALPEHISVATSPIKCTPLLSTTPHTIEVALSYLPKSTSPALVHHTCNI